jgi:RHS repeat-associated protein
VYQDGGLLAVLQNGTIYWNHEDAITKSKRITDSSGNVYSAIELDPWGANTPRSGSEWFQPHRYTSYERDGNGSDEAMLRRFNRWHSRFDQPDPADDSYDTTNPQSLNRYAYTQNDPVNNLDPTGTMCIQFHYTNTATGDGFWTPWYCTPGAYDPAPRGAGLHENAHSMPNQTPKKPDNAACDKKLAGLFGGDGAVADTGKTPSTLEHPTAGMQRFPDHSAEGGVMHLYTNAQGTPASVGLYVPQGFTAVPGGRGTKYYPNTPGQVNAGQVNYNYAQYRNAAGITISFVHIGAPAGPKTNDMGSTLVGSIAGPGGDAENGYNHTHINFYSNFAKGTRVDPRKLFCKEFGF